MLYNGIPESKCVLNPYGVDTSLFSPREALPAKPTFVCVGHICLRKGHQYLFRAFEQAKRVLGDAELICAGLYYPDFRREWKRWKGTFTHYPELPPARLAALLRGATAFVLPSNEEGFARAIIEAMSAGLPIIATHESGASTLVDDGVEGFLVRARDVDHLAQAMIQAASDPARNERMGRAAHARGGKNNSWGDYTDRALNLYAEALERRARRKGVSQPQ
jgi:glycosyltransferase involved in cell wall biosynthesis